MELSTLQESSVQTKMTNKIMRFFLFYLQWIVYSATSKKSMKFLEYLILISDVSQSILKKSNLFVVEYAHIFFRVASSRSLQKSDKINDKSF